MVNGRRSGLQRKGRGGSSDAHAKRAWYNLNRVEVSAAAAPSQPGPATAAALGMCTYQSSTAAPVAALPTPVRIRACALACGRRRLAVDAGHHDGGLGAGWQRGVCLPPLARPHHPPLGVAASTRRTENPSPASWLPLSAWGNVTGSLPKARPDGFKFRPQESSSDCDVTAAMARHGRPLRLLTPPPPHNCVLPDRAPHLPHIARQPHHALARRLF
jgi:hypothetical protein